MLTPEIYEEVIKQNHAKITEQYKEISRLQKIIDISCVPSPLTQNIESYRVNLDKEIERLFSDFEKEIKNERPKQPQSVNELDETRFYTYCCPRCKSVLVSLQVPFKELINVHCQHCNSVIRIYGLEGSEPEIIRRGYNL
jgi:hypothetical protein